MLKKFMTVVMAMVCVFSLCLFGCGNDVPEVFSGNYEEMNSEKIETLLSDIGEKQGQNTDIDFTKGIDFSIKMEMESSGAGADALNGKIDYSLKTKLVDKNIILAGKINTDLGAVADENVNMEIYYADGTAYYKTDDAKIKTKLDFDDVMKKFDINVTESVESYDFRSILEQVELLNNKDDLKAKMPELDLGLDVDYDYDVSKAKASIDTSNNQTKLKVELEFAMDMNLMGVVSKTETDAVYYYLFDKNYNLIGMYVDGTIKTEATYDKETTKMEITMNISAVPFDGEIEAPKDLDTYK